jgi:uncharacterized protein YdaU (DUF1376 family)
MNYYERHLGDYARDAGHLSMLEHGAYTLLLDRYYTTQKGIPADQAHRLCRARTEQEIAAVDAVLTEFFELIDGTWRNGRAEREIQRMLVKIEAARTNGRLGGRPKKNPLGTHQEPTGLADGLLNQTQSKAHQTPDTRHQTPVEKERGRACAPAASPRPPKVPKPEQVDAEVWADWLALRKAKRAPVTATVLKGAIAEAGKAGMPLEAFLRVWCRRGSQGLEAAWLRPDEAAAGGSAGARLAAVNEAFSGAA